MGVAQQRAHLARRALRAVCGGIMLVECTQVAKRVLAAPTSVQIRLVGTGVEMLLEVTLFVELAVAEFALPHFGVIVVAMLAHLVRT